MQDQLPGAGIETRVEQYTQDSDLSWVTAVLSAQRAVILTRWLTAVGQQLFHLARPEGAVSDHIPALFDALVAFLQRSAPRRVDPGAPLDDPAVLQTAEQHAQARLEQGLQPVDVVTEFRLLRHEIVGALRRHLPDAVPASDVLAAELLLHDAIDGVISVALRALTERIELVREDFLVTTVHDVRQPLSLIIGSAQMVARRLRSSEPDLARTAADVERIDRSASRMSALLTTLLDASRITLHHLELQRQPLDLLPLMQTVIAQLGPEIGGRVTVQVDNGVSTDGEWDPTRLDQVFTNLLSNAVKYSPPASPIALSLSGDAAQIECTVRDHGMGVPEDELPRLFQRYARSSAAVESGIQGLGLGLYLCRGIIEAHGGRIWATSSGPGEGTAVHVALPRWAPAPISP